MTNAQFNAGTRSQPLGDAKAGLSADLDALAAYVASLNAFAPSPLRNADGTLTAAATAGKQVFQAKNCASCHGGSGIHGERGQQPGGHRHDQRRQRQAPRRSAHGHRHPDAARRVGDGALPAPRFGRDAGRRHPRARGRHRDATRNSRTSSPTSRRSAARRRSAAATTPNTGTGLAGAYFNNIDAHRQPGPPARREGQLHLERLAGPGRQRGPVLGALDRLRRGGLDRQLPVPDALERRRAPVDQRRARDRQLDRARARPTTRRLRSR